jgi:ankyrin repeat protein
MNIGSPIYSTPLYKAALEEKVDMVKLLLEAGADVNAVYEHGRTTSLHRGQRRATPLHWAVSKGPIDMVKLLLEAGADVNVTNVYGDTPLHMAASESGLEAVEITKLLIQKGADVNAKNNHSKTPSAVAHSSNSDVAKLLRSHGGK